MVIGNIAKGILIELIYKRWIVVTILFIPSFFPNGFDVCSLMS